MFENLKPLHHLQADPKGVERRWAEAEGSEFDQILLSGQGHLRPNRTKPIRQTRHILGGVSMVIRESPEACKFETQSIQGPAKSLRIADPAERPDFFGSNGLQPE